MFLLDMTTCVSVTVAVLGARGLDREMVYMISLVWFPSSSFFHGWYTISEKQMFELNKACLFSLHSFQGAQTWLD